MPWVLLASLALWHLVFREHAEGYQPAHAVAVLEFLVDFRLPVGWLDLLLILFLVGGDVFGHMGDERLFLPNSHDLFPMVEQHALFP